jgi:hypothetical protein
MALPLRDFNLPSLGGSFRMRRALLLAGLSMMAAPISRAAEVRKKNNIVPCQVDKVGRNGTVKAPVSSSGTSNGKRYFVCKDCLMKRAVQRSAFVNKEA